MTRLSSRPYLNARGFTLLELIIALGIGVGILLALTLMFSRNSGNQQELERTLRQVENARFALDTLAEDLQHAGFYSDFNPAGLEGALVTSPDPCATATNQQGWTEPETTSSPAVPLAYPLPVIGIRSEPGDDSTVVVCLANRLKNTEAIVIRHAETTGAANVAATRAGNLYIQTPRCQTQAKQLRIQPGPGGKDVFNLQPANCDAASFNNEVRRLVQRTYYVARCNDCAGAGDRIPTLKRVEMVDGQLRTTSIAEGVENLQFEFGVDNAPAVLDGVPDEWLPIGKLPAADWPLLVAPGVLDTDNRRNVVSVRVHMLTRATQATPGFAETRTYQLGTVTLAPKDLAKDQQGYEYKRSLLSTSVRLNNVGGRRER